MTIKSYNFKNQILNSDELANLLAFASDKFAGALSEEDCPISNSGTTMTVGPGHILGGGHILELVENESYTMTNNSLIVLRVLYADNLHIDDDENPNITLASAGTITDMSDPYYEVVQVRSPEGNPAEKHYYILETEGLDHYVRCDNLTPPETEINPDHTYYSLIQTYYTITLSDGRTYNSGTTQFVKNNLDELIGFDVVLGALYNNQFFNLLPRRSKESYRDYLTAEAYEGLKKYMEETFVWHEGGTEKVGDYAKGQLGTLIFSGSTITNINTVSPLLIDPTVIDASRIHIGNLSVGNPNTPIYLEGGVFKEGTTIDSNNPLAVERGGTGANNATTAKMNLRLFHGESDPDEVPANNLQYYLYDTNGALISKYAPLGQPRAGDIYFKIIKNEIPFNSTPNPTGINITRRYDPETTTWSY